MIWRGERGGGCYTAGREEGRKGVHSKHLSSRAGRLAGLLVYHLEQSFALHGQANGVKGRGLEQQHISCFLSVIGC